MNYEPGDEGAMKCDRCQEMHRDVERVLLGEDHPAWLCGGCREKLRLTPRDEVHP